MNEFIKRAAKLADSEREQIEHVRSYRPDLAYVSLLNEAQKAAGGPSESVASILAHWAMMAANKQPLPFEAIKKEVNSMRVHEFKMPPQSGKTTTAVALVHGFRALCVPALYVAPTAPGASLIVSQGLLPADWVVSGRAGFILRAAPVLVFDDVSKFPFNEDDSVIALAQRQVAKFSCGTVYAFY